MERKRVDTRKTSPEPKQFNRHWKPGRSSGKSETVRRVKDAIAEHLDSPTQSRNKTLRALQHKAIPFVMGAKTVRKRVYFRWCIRRGLDPTQRENVVHFANRRQWQRQHSETKRLRNEAKQKNAALYARYDA